MLTPSPAHSPAHSPQAHAAMRATAIPADLFDATWLASLAAVRRRVVLLLGAGLVLLVLGGHLLSAAHTESAGYSEAWPICVAGVIIALAGVTALGAMVRVARGLG